MVVAEKIEIFNKKKDFIVKQIIENNLLMVNGNYDYLLDLKINTFTLEKITELTKKVESLKAQIETLRVTSISTLWNTELLSLEF